MTVHEVELWVMVDEDGAYVVRADPDDLADAYDSEVGSDAGKCRRTVKVRLLVPVESYVQLEGMVPAEGKAALEIS